VIRDITVRFGGLLALDSMSLSAPLGRITGLIGPNGAGKTTAFNVCTGVVRPSAGEVLLFDEIINDLPASARAQRGLGRTFQRIELFDSLSVLENIALGHEAGLAGRRTLRQVVSGRGDRARVLSRAEAELQRCGLENIAYHRAGDVSTGQRRLVELARLLAGDFNVLLLDEPSSGLDGTETAHFAALLRRVASERNLSVLLVEHDMSLVMDVCAYLYVLDFGSLLFEGTPQDTATSNVVRTAYLGVSEGQDAGVA
jgi:ABC-type branched-subunit amino acid transport system ATPase component